MEFSKTLTKTEESFMKKYGTKTNSEREAMNHDFLATLPLSPKTESE